MTRLKILLILLTGLLLAACGIDEYYFLPQVPAGNITSNTFNATINIPNISGSQYYYASGYIIYYKIYISDHSESGTINTSSLRLLVSPSLESDYNFFNLYSDPTETSIITTTTTFSGRNYHLVDTNITASGGSLSINFLPTASFSLDGTNISFLRSRNLISAMPNNRFFLNTPELLNSNYAISNINADVVISGSSEAYVSMYIVTSGLNPENFYPIYSKPTHIGIFLLP
jgi:hypothetical protein